MPRHPTAHPHRHHPHHPRPGPTRRARHLVALACGALALVACGDDGPAPGGASGELPTPEASFFTAGELDDVMLPRGATEAGDKTERAGAIAQSFTVTATSPEAVMSFFDDQLRGEGWETVEPVEPTGTDSFAGAWVRDQRRLEVSALLAQGVEDERTQFSLVLLPSTADGADLNDG